MSETDKLIQQAMRILARLEAETRSDIPLFEITQLRSLAYSLNGRQRNARPELATKLGVKVSLLDELFDGVVFTRHDAIVITERIISSLRSTPPTHASHGDANDSPETPHTIMDGGDFQRDDDDDNPVAADYAANRDTRVAPASETSPRDNVIRPRRWVKVPAAPDLQEHIRQLEALLPDLLEHTRFTNLPEGERGFTDEERARLIDLLETAVATLKAPLVEEGLLIETSKSLGRGLVKIGSEAPEKILYVTGALFLEHLNKIIEFFMH